MPANLGRDASKELTIDGKLAELDEPVGSAVQLGDMIIAVTERQATSFTIDNAYILDLSGRIVRQCIYKEKDHIPNTFVGAIVDNTGKVFLATFHESFVLVNPLDGSCQLSSLVVWDHLISG